VTLCSSKNRSASVCLSVARFYSSMLDDDDDDKDDKDEDEDEVSSLSDVFKTNIPLLDGPIAVRLRALTTIVDAACRRADELDGRRARDATRACVRGCRDACEGIVNLARRGLFRILHRALEVSNDVNGEDEVTTTTLRAIVFACVEHASAESEGAFRAQTTRECERALARMNDNDDDDDDDDSRTRYVMQSLARGCYVDAARILRPDEMRVKPRRRDERASALRKREEDIEKARRRRREADARAMERAKYREEEEKRREMAFVRRARCARASYKTGGA